LNSQVYNPKNRHSLRPNKIAKATRKRVRVPDLNYVAPLMCGHRHAHLAILDHLPHGPRQSRRALHDLPHVASRPQRFPAHPVGRGTVHNLCTGINSAASPTGSCVVLRLPYYHDIRMCRMLRKRTCNI